MITVEKAKAMVKEFEDAQKVQLEQKISEICETVVSPKIEEGAKQGHRVANVEVDNKLRYQVMEELKKQGWGCFAYGSKGLEIHW